MYMVDFEILDDIPHYGQNDKEVQRRYTCAALGLFYVKGSGDTIPIAIQFHQVPSETNPIWTPNDSELDWTYAKMWLRNADTQWHQVSSLVLYQLLPYFRSCYIIYKIVVKKSECQKPIKRLPDYHRIHKIGLEVIVVKLHLFKIESFSCTYR